eukprot:CAMPEP_0201944790 /NCGR_PEP_ID=MMETSP0903-20130614/53575_1 /ASSEMBLY_ACC=CAM_ASM_000552 /TAXON_ID=420261 /ORGANISM="Thalassiosira antarctica, Strain CCMP982" /LENGTH=138 /DNA_ID=CAMNT_0048487845 /DNA_START=447 /DNA_END=863 /DNA_ORIENTATION=-
MAENAEKTAAVLNSKLAMRSQRTPMRWHPAVVIAGRGKWQRRSHPAVAISERWRRTLRRPPPWSWESWRCGASERRWGGIPWWSSLGGENGNGVLIPRWPSVRDGGERREDRRGGRGRASECVRSREDRNGGKQQGSD